MHAEDVKVPIVGDGHCAMNAMLVQTLITFAYIQQQGTLEQNAVFQALKGQYRRAVSNSSEIDLKMQLQYDINDLVKLLISGGRLDVKDATGQNRRRKNVTGENLEKYNRLFKALLLTLSQVESQDTIIEGLREISEYLVLGMPLENAVVNLKSDIKNCIIGYKSQVLNNEVLNNLSFLDSGYYLSELVVNAYQAWLQSTVAPQAVSPTHAQHAFPSMRVTSTRETATATDAVRVTTDGLFPKIVYADEHFDVLVPVDVANVLNIKNALQTGHAQTSKGGSSADSPAAVVPPSDLDVGVFTQATVAMNPSGADSDGVTEAMAYGSQQEDSMSMGMPKVRMEQIDDREDLSLSGRLHRFSVRRSLVKSLSIGHSDSVQHTMANDQQWVRWCVEKNICHHFSFGDYIAGFAEDGWDLKRGSSTDYTNRSKQMTMHISYTALFDSALSAQSVTITYRANHDDKQAGREAARALIAKNNWDPSSSYEPVVSIGNKQFKAGAKEYIQQYKAQYKLAKKKQQRATEVHEGATSRTTNRRKRWR